MSLHPLDRESLRSRVEAALEAFLARQRAVLASIDPALTPFSAAIDALVLGSAKRLRPAFAYWGYRGAGGPDRDEIVTALASLELVQAGALIHDDVMDASDTRRGEPAVHRRFEQRHREAGWQGDGRGFGESAAILAGDLCLTWSDELLHTAGVDADALRRARSVFDDMRTEVMVGQYLDVLASVSADTSVERAGKIARYKSAKYTIERPLLLGAALADAPAALSAAYSDYGLALGEAFQLRDDVLGVFGDPVETGKPAGDDLREGKRTYLIATAYQRVDAIAGKMLDSGVGDPDLDDERVAELRAIISDSGALAATESRIDELTTHALDVLSGLDLAGGAGDVLTELAEAAVRRRR